jgi:hypothetical protein
MAEIGTDNQLMLSALQVQGFKSLRDCTKVTFAALTVLAGANSSGKSSLMQPLLLLKQTFDPAYDPGPLWLGGPNVIFSDTSQIFWQAFDHREHRFTVGLLTPGWNVEIAFEENGEQPEASPLRVARCIWGSKGVNLALTPDMSLDEIEKASKGLHYATSPWRPNSVRRYRAFLALAHVSNSDVQFELGPWSDLPYLFRNVIHVPGLRGNPERTYKRIPSSEVFPGLFQDYVASVIARWQQEESEALQQTCEELSWLGLTDRVRARSMSATELELRVGRLMGQTNTVLDMVNIADVGFGVSQALPMVVALSVARPGQIVYIEQPETHLHPRAQVALADLLARAVRRGVQVVIETHSELLLLSIQRLVASGELAPDVIALHWFQRDDEGVTRVTPAELDKDGAFGEWPVDFADVSVKAMRDYLDAVTSRRRGHE